MDLNSTALCDLPNPPLRAGRQVDHSEQDKLPFTGHTSHCAPTSLLRTYVPGNLGEYVRRLETHGVTDTELSRVVHS